MQFDLHEVYAYWIQKEGLPKAQQRYIWMVLRLLRPFASKVTTKDDVPPPLFHFGMTRNYFKIAWYTLLNQWQYSVVNITGLAVGMVCCIFICKQTIFLFTLYFKVLSLSM